MLLHTDRFNRFDLFFSHIDIFKAVHEGHINRRKFGNALIREIVTVFVTDTGIFFFFPVFDFFERPDKTYKETGM